MSTASGPLWLGLDLGTQSVRALAVDETGGIAGSGAAPLTSHRDGSRHEQDPEQWWTAATSACHAALAGLDASRIQGVAVDATSGTLLLADGAGRPLTAGLMYDDGRASAEAARVNDRGAAVWKKLGYQRVQPSWALPKLVWLLRHRPELAQRADLRILHQPDYVTWQLTGHQLPTDASHALKTGYDLVEERWPAAVLADLEVPEGALPEVVRPGAVLGAVGASGSTATGLPVGTSVIAGMTDGCAAQLGAGGLARGAWNSVLGTTLVLKGASDHLVRDPGGVVYCHRGPGETWLPGGASSSGAGALSQHFPGADFDELTTRAAKREPDVVAYPLASAAGERFPFRASTAEQFILGQPANDADLFFAYLLGVACVERLCLDYLDLLGAPTDGPLTLTGGGARNRYWCQLRADVLGRPVLLPDQAEPALGMAVLAASSADADLVEKARTMVRVREEIHPRPGYSSRWSDSYLRLGDELTHRGWLDAAVNHHARRRATQ